MAKTNPISPRPEMEERDPTLQEVLNVVGTDMDIPPLTARPDPTRDEDYEDPPSRVASPTLGDMQTRMATVLESMEAKLNGPATDSSRDQIAAAMQMMAEAMNGFRTAQLQGANTIADMQRRTVRPENNFTPNISSFNLRGEKDFPRPTLRCPMNLPWPADQDVLTREEIELLNLLQDGEYVIYRADRTVIRMRVSAEKKLDSDDISKLTIHHDTAFNNDQHRLMPYDWLRQMVERHPKTSAQGKAVLTMEEEEALIAGRRFNDGRLAEPHEAVLSLGT